MNQHISTRDLHQVVSCKLGLMSAEEIKNLSVGEIFNIKPYDMQSMYPTRNGINDAKMGSTNRRWNCLTCYQSAIECQGHFGHIQLAQPVYHLGFLPIIQKILNCVCFNCQKLLCVLEDDQINRIKRVKSGLQRLQIIYKLCQSIRVCDNVEKQDQPLKRLGCGSKQPKFQKQKLYIKDNENNMDDPNQERNLLPEQCLQIFKRISDEDCFLLGFDTTNTRPENMILQVLPVAPPSIRPAIQMDSTQRAEDDLTHQYTSILKINNKMKEMIDKGLPQSQLEKNLDQLQYFISTLMDNDINGIIKATRKSGQPIKSIRERLKGKEGRLRKNLMGKRVDFSARTVVSPDPNLALDELGVPRSIAMNLTFPETVTQLNVDKLKQLVITGPSEWPGAKSIIRNDGKQFDLRYIQNREEIQLDYGMIVERHIVDGDFVVFNRQPSLHRMSMMGHRIKILPFSSFRLNLSVTTPYNADFDGDEMNMHVPQSYESKTEIKNIMHVPRQIVTPQANRPVMGIVQDALLGIRLFTRRNTFLTKSQVMNLIFWIDDWNGELPQPAILKPKKLWTGKQIISMILPNVNLERKCNVYGDPTYTEDMLFQRDGKIIIEKGELLTGMLDKGTVGNTSGGVIHCIWLDEGPLAAASFLSSAQKIINNWLTIHGFSVGASDIFPDDECNISVQKDLQKAQQVVPLLYQKAENKQMDHQPGKSMLESFEANVNNDLNNLFKEASQKAQSSMNDKNRIYCMVAAGSKGSNMNIAQILVCVGQQNVEGQRIPYGFHRRTLPHFSKDDYGPAPRGFVKNSYLTGLRPDEFFFHAMGGREGLIDTAVKTSDTGYIQRKLIKCFEDVMVKYDSTVRDCIGNVVQFIYGEDGMAGEFLENCQIQRILELKDQDLEREYRFFNQDDPRDISEQLQQYERYLEQNILEEIMQNPQDLEIIQSEFIKIKNHRDQIRNILRLDLDQKFFSPVNLQRLINNVKINYKHLPQQKSKLNPVYVIQKIDDLIKNLIVVQGNDQIGIEAQNNAILFLTAQIRFFLSSKKVCIIEKLSPEMFNDILGEIESKFQLAKVHPGEMIGIICAQSIGEPTTQMTLNTFHTAGISAKNVTLGVPRIKEILNASKNIKTPSMSIYIEKQTEINDSLKDESVVLKELQSSLEFTTLGHLTIKSEIYFDPDYENTIIDDDIDVVKGYLDYPDEEDVDKVCSWMLRFELDKNALIDRNITSRQIKNKIMEYLPDKVQIIYDDRVMPEKPVIRLRLKDLGIPTHEQVDVLKGIEYKLLRSFKLKGVQGIKKVFMKKDKIKQLQDDGSLKKFDEWMLETDGSNLKQILMKELVDFTRTFSNSCIEMYESLGIEAARQSIIKEIKMILDVYGIYINQRHLITLADLMTRQGEVKPVTRHGINKIVQGPFRKASFEQTVEQLFTAGVFSEVQQMLGITENIMFGQLGPLGTGSFQLMLNTEEIKQAKYVPDLYNNIPGDNEFINQMDQDNQDDCVYTPYNPRTPGPNFADTPRNASPFIDSGMGGFTPQAIFKSPVYIPDKTGFQTIKDNNPVIKQINIFSPTYPISSPGYGSIARSSSPKYSPASPIINMTHSPASPSYTNSSPSYSPGGKRQSPNSPSYNNPYSIQSPLYGQRTYSVSPSSPNYSGSPISNSITPSSGSGNLTIGNSNIYSPNSPQYNLPSAQYNPKSPVYDPSNQQQDQQYQSSSEDDNEI